MPVHTWLAHAEKRAKNRGHILDFCIGQDTREKGRVPSQTRNPSERDVDGDD